MRKSPFQFLDAYTLEEKDAFFGRDKEIEVLYDMVFKSPMLLVYGLSGTGKTSLIQCGLAGKFDGPDWYPFFIRRNENINDSLHAALQIALKGKDKGNLVTNIEYITKRYLRPVYLIFDQFEEIFIMGSQEEQEEFMTNIKTLLEADLSTKILLVMREEYLGQLYPFENILPNLLDFRMRVERMGPKSIKNVISSSFEKFDIHFQPPKDAETLTDLMIENISDEKGVIPLPYLQVYLDQIYQHDFERTYKEAYTGTKPLDFTRQEIEEFGKIDDVLERFLENQEQLIQENLMAKYPDFPEEGVRQVLDAFATDEGTKLPVKYKADKDKYLLQNQEVARNLSFLEPDILAETFRSLDRSRLLRISQDNIELAHDTLAALIDQKRTDKQRQLLEVRKRLINSYDEFKRSNQYLNPKQLAVFSQFIPLLNLDQQVLDFVSASEKEIERLEQFETERQRKELEAQEEKKRAQLLAEKATAEKEKVLAEKEAMKARRRSRVFLLTASIIVLAVFAGYLWNANKINKERSEVEATARKLAEEARDSLDVALKEVRDLKDSISQISEQRREIIKVVRDQMKNLDAIADGDNPDPYQVVSTVIYIQGVLEGKSKTTIENEAFHAFITDPGNFYLTNQIPRGRNRKPPKKDSFRANETIYIYAGIRTTQSEKVVFEVVKPGGDTTVIRSDLRVDPNASRTGYRLSPDIKRRDHTDPGEYTAILKNGIGTVIGTAKFTIR